MLDCTRLFQYVDRANKLTLNSSSSGFFSSQASDDRTIESKFVKYIPKMLEQRKISFWFHYDSSGERINKCFFSDRRSIKKNKKRFLSVKSLKRDKFLDCKSLNNQKKSLKAVESCKSTRFAFNNKSRTSHCFNGFASNLRRIYHLHSHGAIHRKCQNSIKREFYLLNKIFIVLLAR